MTMFWRNFFIWFVITWVEMALAALLATGALYVAHLIGAAA